MRNIRTFQPVCGCGSSTFAFIGYGGDGACESWVIGECTKCGDQHELWDSYPSTYEFFLTPEQDDELKDQVLNGMRASFALEGVTISDSNFEKLKKLIC